MESVDGGYDANVFRVNYKGIDYWVFAVEYLSNMFDAEELGIRGYASQSLRDLLDNCMTDRERDMLCHFED